MEPLICFFFFLSRIGQDHNPLKFTLTVEISESRGPFPDNTVCLCSLPAGIETSFISQKGPCCALRKVPALDPNKHVQLAAETQSDLIAGALVCLQASAATFKGREYEQETSRTVLRLWDVLIMKQVAQCSDCGMFLS